MDNKKTLNKLKEDIQDIYSIVNRFENSEKIHQLDIDLALSKVRNLYELFLKFNSQDTYTAVNQQKEISTITKKNKNEEIVEKLITEEPEVEETMPEEKITEPQITNEPEPEIKEKHEQVIKEDIYKEPELIIETPKESEKPNAKTLSSDSKEIVADKFQSKKFIHDNIIKNGAKNDVSSKMQSKPIHDINTAIGLNDKFIFIRELFGGDKNQYIETIQVLNNFDTFDNALDFLNNNFDWNPEDENFIRLTELVKRKYS